MRSLGTGEMSRATGLSVKALRLYDANGLLTPAEVDPATGYRRYAPEQVARGRSIAALRRLDVPLAVVGSLLDGPPAELRSRLLAWWAQERAGFALRTQTVEFAAAVVDTVRPADAPSAVPDRAVRIEARPAQAVATITRSLRQHELVPSALSDVVAIRETLDAEGATALSEHWLLFHEPVGFELAGRVETCVPYEGSARPHGQVVLREEPAARFAVVDVTVRELEYPALLRFYDAVRAVAGSPRGTAAAGAPREWYGDAWPDDPDAIAAQIAMPLAAADAVRAEHSGSVAAGVESAPGADSRVVP
ncbi:MerR family transcriptional regulator [Agromyces intestinalis]|nr:MerR family transcriptional regulator [Agromyces intestinalis]